MIDELGASYFHSSIVRENGFQKYLDESIKYFKDKKIPFGISLDVDGIDPDDFSSTGTPHKNGIALCELLESFEKIDPDQLIGLEIAEYNPKLEDDVLSGLTAMDKILNSFFKPTNKR